MEFLSFYYETMLERGTILSFYHLFLLAGGCRANGKRYAQETRDKGSDTTGFRDILTAINHLATTFQRFAGSNRREIAEKVTSLDGDGSRFSNIWQGQKL